MKTGLFVGSFNPITKAHLNIARHLVNKKVVNKIIFLPVANNDKKLESLEDRIKMINLVINNSKITVTDIMNSYTKFNYKVINELHNTYKDLYLIIGFDLIKNSDGKSYFLPEDLQEAVASQISKGEGAFLLPVDFDEIPIEPGNLMSEENFIKLVQYDMKNKK